VYDSSARRFAQDDGFVGGLKHSRLDAENMKRSKKSQALLMTKRRVSVSSGNWFEGSQVSKARPGAPFDFTLRYCRGHKLCHCSPDSPQRVGCSGWQKKQGGGKGTGGT